MHSKVDPSIVYQCCRNIFPFLNDMLKSLKLIAVIVNVGDAISFRIEEDLS